MKKGKRDDNHVHDPDDSERSSDQTRESSFEAEIAPESQTPEECVIESSAEAGLDQERETAPIEEATVEAPALVTLPVAELEQIKKSVEEYRDKLLRLAAEFDNYRKRMQKERLSWEESVKESIVLELLPVMDNFERAVEAMKSGQDNDGIKEGIIIIHQQLMDVLKAAGVERFSAVGDKFDPNKHEALLKVESDKYPEDVVSQELVKGYKLKDKVIRPARVTISAGMKKEETQQAE